MNKSSSPNVAQGGKGASGGKKEVKGAFRLILGAGQAKPAPPVGSSLGQRGLNIMNFCKAFNEMTTKPGFVSGAPYVVHIVYYTDKTFDFTVHQAPTSSYLIKEVMKKNGITGDHKDLKKGKLTFISFLTYEQIEDIARKKLADMGAYTLKAAMNSIVGSAYSMRVRVDPEIRLRIKGCEEVVSCS
jgi:large subunit ribosomal protein L11